MESSRQLHAEGDLLVHSGLAQRMEMPVCSLLSRQGRQKAALVLLPDVVVSVSEES